MLSMKNNLVVCFDVDDSLLFWDTPKTTEGVPYIMLNNRKVYVHHEHVDILKKYSDRGYIVIVWSKGGGEWAEKAVKSIGLEKYVHFTMNKPSSIYDDLEPCKWMPKANYVKRDKYLDEKEGWND